MRKTGAIIVLLVLLTNGAGFYVYYIIQLQQIRKEMREALKLIPEHELEILKLTEEQFLQARVEDHEVRVNGKMYDIARVKLQEETVWVYCLHDEKEDNLLAFLNEIVGKPLKDKTPRQILQFISLSYLLPAAGFDTDLQEREIKFTFHYCFSLQTFSTCPASPPPWA